MLIGKQSFSIFNCHIFLLKLCFTVPSFNVYPTGLNQKYPYFKEWNFTNTCKLAFKLLKSRPNKAYLSSFGNNSTINTKAIRQSCLKVEKEVFNPTSWYNTFFCYTWWIKFLLWTVLINCYYTNIFSFFYSLSNILNIRKVFNLMSSMNINKMQRICTNLHTSNFTSNKDYILIEENITNFVDQTHFRNTNWLIIFSHNDNAEFLNQ